MRTELLVCNVSMCACARVRVRLYVFVRMRVCGGGLQRRHTFAQRAFADCAFPTGGVAARCAASRVAPQEIQGRPRC
jgi:hypothetical protein